MQILLVDDQTEILLGMVQGIDWEDLGISRVFTASSAEDAKKILREEAVDILLTDIEMPKENGISLVRWVRAENLSTDCVFLTSHADFEYAQEALRLGSFDYILQPARYEAIADVIRRVIREREKSQKSKRIEEYKEYQEQPDDDVADRYLARILEEEDLEAGKRALDTILHVKDADHFSDPALYLALEQQISERDRQWEPALERATILNILEELVEEDNRRLMRLRIRDGYYLILVAGQRAGLDADVLSDKLHTYLQFEQDYLGFSSAIYVYGLLEAGENLREAIRSLEGLSVYNVMGLARVFLRDGMEVGSRGGGNRLGLFGTENWHDLLSVGDGSRIIQSVDSYLEHQKGIEHRNFWENAELLRHVHQNFVSAVLQVMTENGIDYDMFFDKDLTLAEMMRAYDTYEHILKVMREVIRRMEAFRKQQEGKKSPEDPVDQAIVYIREHLDERLTRESVAEHVHLNEDYLSRRFKEKTGYQVKEFINMEKMRLAKELLTGTNLSVSTITMRTGFQNFSHFSQAFRKQEGMSPTEYRAKHRGGM